MSDYSDIINRLRQVPYWDPESQADICKDAIAEIARLRSRAAEAHQWEEMAERTGLPLKPDGAEAVIARLRLAVSALASEVAALRNLQATMPEGHPLSKRGDAYLHRMNTDSTPIAGEVVAAIRGREANK